MDTLHHSQLRTLVQTTRLHAEHRPTTAAVLCEGRTLTYEQLHRESNRIAHALKAAGLVPGDRVAYLGKEAEHYYEILFGCAKSGTVLVPVNWRLAAPEVSHILQDSGTRLLFLEDEFAPIVERMPTAPPETTVALGEDFATWKAAHPDTEPPDTATPDTPVAQLYTSGTTGLPKGVVLAHRSFFAIRDALASEGLDWIDWRPGDIALVGIPGFHIGGLWWATQNFNAGTTVVAMRAFAARQAVDLIRDLGITTACVVPAMLRMMLNEPGVDAKDFTTLRKAVYGGSPISEALLEESLAVLDCEFAQIYGLTETGNTAVCLPPAAHVPGGTLMQAAGRPYPGVRAKVIDGGGRELPPGAVGEVCLATPAHMVEYWGLPDKTAETLVDGWIHTGDAGYLDEDGYIFIRDRIKDAILVAGENVYPAEIENVLEGHPGVAEAVVVGAPDERWGEYVHAFVVPAPEQPPTPRDLHSFLVPQLASFKLPARYEFIDSVPRNPSGKILRRELRDRFWSAAARKVN
ncbi:fatty acid--CoA ligase [Streptomyces caniscabiei]|uniref:Fatty acid--CoA ligase n=1 Tax=Streptomyces caniscabiei TaxID=2746961 RepID=A0A927KZD8_9ACTN|nr:fatty acid--CoA ligase [Streptomyces caniscabiei]MBD9722527.1 fatty acid--CoA ligase [Streptomyces caniscabiei]MDX3515200.1 fatty acid--CoA ligase [Streptomyces caniscabiei]MDX3716518.1 fatty acid--CoA ligase [Streptomyces caniscabiei]WEO22415.1 fatty acid--CoA ligase [Streptomyces caniscabiei]